MPLSRSRWIGVACALIALVVHIQALKGEAVLDDQAVFLENPAVQGSFDLTTIFTTNVFGGKKGLERAGGYRPLTLLTFRLGPSDNLAFQRLLNLLLHALTVWMLWLFFLELGLRNWFAVFSVSIFAVHPVHVDAIVPLNNRSDLLCTLFLISSLFCWLRARDKRLGLVAVALGLLAALSKEQGLLAPFFLLIPTLVWWRRFKLDGASERVVRWRWVFLLVALLLSIVVFLLRVNALGGSVTGLVPPSDNPMVSADYSGRVLGPGLYLLKSLELLAYPFAMSADYTRDALPLPDEWGHVSGWVGLLVFALWAFASLRFLWRGQMVGALSLGGALLAYLVTSNLLVLSTIAFSERALYLPSAFGAVALSLLLQRLLRAHLARPFLPLVGGAITLLLLSSLSFVGVESYRSNMSIAQASIASTPRSARMHSLFGEEVLKKGDRARAQKHFRLALDFDPSSAHAYRGLGRVHFLEGRYEEAALMHEQAVQASKGGMVEAYNDACLAHLRAEAYEKALQLCHAGLLKTPQEAILMTNTARVYLALGKLKESLHWAGRGHRANPREFYPLWHLLLVTMEGGDQDAAKILWQKVKKLKPGDKNLLQFAHQFGFE